MKKNPCGSHLCVESESGGDGERINEMKSAIYQ